MHIQHIIAVTQILEPVLADTLQILNRHTTGDVAIFRIMLCLTQLPKRKMLRQFHTFVNFHFHILLIIFRFDPLNP